MDIINEVYKLISIIGFNVYGNNKRFIEYRYDIYIIDICVVDYDISAFKINFYYMRYEINNFYVKDEVYHRINSYYNTEQDIKKCIEDLKKQFLTELRKNKIEKLLAY